MAQVADVDMVYGLTVINSLFLQAFRLIVPVVGVKVSV